MTTSYIGNYPSLHSGQAFEWTGSTSTMVKYYYTGATRIARRVGGSELYYILGDHLGSTSVVADSSGVKFAETRYKPWGEIRYSSETTPTVYTDYTFQGQYSHTDDFGLMYYVARWYDPYLNQFIQPDPIVPNPHHPWEWNRYIYSRNNPVTFTDPSGLSSYNPQEPPDHRDLTLWLYEEMSVNANGYYAQRIRSKLNGPNLSQKAQAIFGWIFLVKNEAKWDFKHEISRKLGIKSVILNSNEGPAWYEFSVTGNIHYGFVGRAAGFSSFMLHTGAGYAEITDQAHKEHGEACCPKYCTDITIQDPWMTYDVCIPLGCYYFNPSWENTLFDDPNDYWSVEFGVKLYDTYGGRMTYRQFQDQLAVYGGWLTPALTVPSGKFEHPRWPYQVGFFDGPDTNKNKPIVDLLLWRSPFGDY